MSNSRRPRARDLNVERCKSLISFVSNLKSHDLSKPKAGDRFVSTDSEKNSTFYLALYSAYETNH